jgi:hypothetical protein
VELLDEKPELSLPEGTNRSILFLDLLNGSVQRKIFLVAFYLIFSYFPFLVSTSKFKASSKKIGERVRVVLSL